MHINGISSLSDDAGPGSMEIADTNAAVRGSRHDSETRGIPMKSTLSSVDARAFIRAISCAATPVTIVTTLARQQRWGQTVSAVSRVSDEPAVLGVCINRRSPINAAIQHSADFNVSLLGPDHRGVADIFAGRRHGGRDPFTFDDAQWSPGRNGLPVYTAGVASFECALVSVTDVGSHHLYLGAVRHVVHTDAEPLLHLRGSYRTLSDHHMEGQHA
ncbi:flavin reductase family protein [Mycolicibacterium neoaurum]|uniref:flavin reductase family protein n=2 Tax=Mycolicibacterium neoaurum TaxID=1795 RepID=UPI003014CA84